jgi:hypothetical protein
LSELAQATQPDVEWRRIAALLNDTAVATVWDEYREQIWLAAFTLGFVLLANVVPAVS